MFAFYCDLFSSISSFKVTKSSLPEFSGYPLVNIQKTMENHHAIYGKITKFQWPCSIAILTSPEGISPYIIIISLLIIYYWYWTNYFRTIILFDITRGYIFFNILKQLPKKNRASWPDPNASTDFVPSLVTSRKSSSRASRQPSLDGKIGEKIWKHMDLLNPLHPFTHFFLGGKDNSRCFRNRFSMKIITQNGFSRHIKWNGKQMKTVQWKAMRVDQRLFYLFFSWNEYRDVYVAEMTLQSVLIQYRNMWAQFEKAWHL